jgi:hypothetical protein
MFNKKVRFLVFLPIILMLFDVGFVFYESGSIITYFKAIIVIVFLVLNFKELTKYFLFNKYIIIFSLYVLILLPFSNEFETSLRNTIKAIPQFFYFFVGIHFFRSKKEFDALSLAMIFLIVISFIGSIVGYMWGIGGSFAYGVDDLGSAGLLSGGKFYPVAISVTILFAFIAFKEIKFNFLEKTIFLTTTFGSYVFILLSMRRTAIALPIIGILTLMFQNRQLFSKNLKIVIIMVVLFSITSPLYINMLTVRFERRKEMGRFEENFYETEARYVSTVKILQDIASFNNPTKILFGTNVLAGGWKGGEAHRMLHADQEQLLDTTGIFGFLLYILIFIKFYLLYKRMKVFEKKSQIKHLYSSMFLSIILISVAIMLNGSLFIVTFRTIAFLYMGALVGQLIHTRNNLTIYNNPDFLQSTAISKY